LSASLEMLIPLRLSSTSLHSVEKWESPTASFEEDELVLDKLFEGNLLPPSLSQLSIPRIKLTSPNYARRFEPTSMIDSMKSGNNGEVVFYLVDLERRSSELREQRRRKGWQRSRLSKKLFFVYGIMTIRQNKW